MNVESDRDTEPYHIPQRATPSTANGRNKLNRSALRTKGTENITNLIERGKILTKNTTPATKTRENRKEMSPNEERNSKEAKKIKGVSTSDSERETAKEGEAFQRSTKVKRSPVKSRKKERSKK